MDFVTHFYDNPAYPNNTYTVAHPTFDDHSRIIAISDIHGNLPYFRGLVEKLHLRADDSLVLLGDLVEKGPESLATLRYAMALREKCRVYPVLGNCDFWHLWVDGCDMEWDVRTFAHLLRQKATARSGLILEMCAELGEVLSPDTDLAALKALLREAFAPEFEYLRAMPFALESDKYIFVHGGIPHGETLESAGPWRCMKINSFYAARPHFKKWVITGHTPVCLYGTNTISAVPVVDPACRVASIDGGCVLKDDGQLNCLIISGINGDDISFTSYDRFPVRTVLKAQAEGGRSYYSRWGDSHVQVLERGAEFSRCRHVRTGYEMDILTKYLFEPEEFTDCNDCTDYVLPLHAGDKVSVVEETSRGYFVKHNGVSGWYFGALE